MTPETFNRTYVPLRPRLLATALRDMTDAQQAEDLVQETLLRLWNMGDQLDKHPNTTALAHTILRNLMRDAWRQAQHRLTTMPSYTPEALLTAPENEATEGMELITRIVEQLPPVQAQVFRMKEIEGYEREEIRQIIGCSDENLRQILSRTRRKIQQTYLRLSEKVR